MSGHPPRRPASAAAHPAYDLSDMTSPTPKVSAEVAAALNSGRAVTALESTVFSLGGLPEERNAEALRRSVEAVEAQGATPAVLAVLDGELRVGLSADELGRILETDRKTAERDLPLAIAERWPVGATTVSASLAISHAAGIKVFATGGIGGVHRNSAQTGDVSTDLQALARYPLATVCSGAKAFLDLPLTLERLESLGVPVVGYCCDELPAFWSRRSGHPLAHRVDGPEEAAAVTLSLMHTGALFVVPAPVDAEVPWEEMSPAVETALAEAERQGVSAGAVTPYVLERIATATRGRSVDANVEVVVNNARSAAAIAVALAAKRR